MFIIRAVIITWVALGSLTLLSCERSSSPPVPVTPREPELEVHLKPLMPLMPNRPTHIAADSGGKIYWLQDLDRADDTMFAIDQEGLPQATPLSSAGIAAAMGASGGRGSIHGIAAGSDGTIYFYFQGTHEKRFLACFGRFDPSTSAIRVLAATDHIAEATAMGRSLPLASGAVIGDGKGIWLFLRHTDMWAVFHVDPSAVPPEGSLTLKRAFESVSLDNRPIAMTRDDVEISPAGEDSLFLLDRGNAQLLRVALDGTARLDRSLEGLPSELSTPALDDQSRVLIFAPARAGSAATPALPARDRFGLTEPVTATTRPIDATFPSLLIFHGEKPVRSIGRDRINAYPGFPIYGLRLTQLVAHPAAKSWLTYDSNTGELFLLSIRER